MDYTSQLNAIISLLTQINNSLSVGGVVYEGLHYLIAYMIIAVVVVLVGFAFVYFLFKLFGVR
jgi:hypothetical protein